jgi:hypothetical protein
MRLAAFRTLALFLLPVLSASAVFAQPSPTAPHAPGHRSAFALAVDPGLSTAASNTGIAIGGTLTAAIGERLSLEGTVRHLDRGDGVTGLLVGAGVRVNLVASSRQVVPYVVGGGGVYRASLDMESRGLFGMMNGNVPPGTQMVPLSGSPGFGMMGGSGFTGPWPGMVGPGPGFGPGQGQYFGTFTPGNVPAFYARRMGGLTVPMDGQWGTRTFTDPAATLGAGARIDLTNGFFAQPDVRALVVFRGGHGDTIALTSLTFGYRF